MSFKELLLSKDKRMSIISRQMEATMSIIRCLSSYFCSAEDLMFTKSLTFTDWDVHFSVSAGTTS